MNKKEKLATIKQPATQGQKNYIKELLICLTAAYIILIPFFEIVAYTSRGYFAIGGEAFGWIIPLIAAMEVE